MKDKITTCIKNHVLIKFGYSYLLYKIGFMDVTCYRKIKEYIIFKKLKKKYKINPNLTKELELKKIKSIDYNKTIWILWFQGIENSPKIVKECYQSVVEQFVGYNIILLNQNNIKEYIELPKIIIEKVNEGTISLTHFSDILRCALLATYGGLWLDATTFCTGSRELEYIANHDLFVYQDGWFQNNTINMASWLIWAKPNNVILKETLRLLYDYWEKENFLCDYFLFHLMFRISSDYYNDVWRRVPYLNHINNHLLYTDLFSKYDKERYEKIKQITDFHKLSYKADYNKADDTSFYKKVLSVVEK